MDCLFCSEFFTEHEHLFFHVYSHQEIDIISECHSRSFENIDFAQMVNYIRKEKVKPNEVFDGANKWRFSDTYMQPTIEGDRLLRFGEYY